MHNDTEKWSAVRSVLSRVTLAGHRARRHVLATASWARRQPRSRLITSGIGIISIALATWAVLTLLMQLITGLGGGTSTTPPAPPAPAPAPPMWLTEINHIGLWGNLVDSLLAVATQQAPAAGMPPWLLLAIWAGIGVMLLLGAWGKRPRSVICGAYWAAWVAATAYAIWTHTPGGSPAPAALAAGLGLAAGASVWFLPLIAVFVALSAIPLA